MAPIPYSEGMINKYGETIFNYTQNSLISSIISYIINSNTRRSVNLSNWLKTQINNLNPSVANMSVNIANSNNMDEQAYLVMRYVQDNFKYTGDPTQWQASEYWETADESSSVMKGDCEDGAILMYALCILKGIPANRLLIWCGEVQASPTASTGGHACLFYKPHNYPLNFVSLDWCYYPNKLRVGAKNLFEFKDNEIEEYTRSTLTSKWSYYRETWFAFNQDIAYSRFKPTILE
jgi:predicted transglutaminase-like cysteine proteinase